MLVFYIGVKKKKKQKGRNYVILYLENTYRSPKKRGSWETTTKIKRKKKKNIVVVTKKPPLQKTYSSI